MSYVAIKGGEKAIGQAEGLLELMRTRGAPSGELPIEASAFEHQLHFLHSQVIGEGGLYDPELAGLAIKQSLGDPLEAAFFLRAFRCTRERLVNTRPHDTSRMRLIRRISSAFKEIPGGQRLGPSPDFTQRLFKMELLDETPEGFRRVFDERLASVIEASAGDDGRTSLPKVLDALREQKLVAPASEAIDPGEPGWVEPFDITREPLGFPLPRSAVLSSMARAHKGSMLMLAYTSMRGYGDVHPTIAELRVGYLPVELPHPVTGEPMEIGEVLVTECEIVAMFEDEDEARAQGGGGDLSSGRGGITDVNLDEVAGADGLPTFSLGYGCCFGHNEVKAISMAILDRAIQKGNRDGPSYPAEDAEFVVLHCDGVDSQGFCLHWKMPHYVTFQSDLDRLRTARERRRTEAESGTGGSLSALEPVGSADGAGVSS